MPRAVREGARSHERGPRGQGGYTLVAIMIFLTLLSIAILAVSPSVSMMMRRDREQELLFRGKQYAQAILNFQKRQGRFPLTLKELMTTKPRSARKLFREPICNCDDWGLIRVGQPWPPPQTKNNPAGNSFDLFPPSGTTTGQNPGTSPPEAPGQTRPGSPVPTSYTTPPPGGSGNRGGDSGNPAAGSGNAEGGGDSFGGLDLGGDKKEKSNVPIIGVYSKAHQKGLQTFHGQEYYDQWGFIAGANNDPDVPGAQITNPINLFPNLKSSTSPPGGSTGTPTTGSGSNN